MSSNIQVQRICLYCGKEFTARTTVTKYCGGVCAGRAYKATKRTQKVEAANRQTEETKRRPLEQLSAKDYLSITEACVLLSVSRWTIWRAIKNGDLTAGGIGRRVLIKRSDLDKLLRSNPLAAPDPIPEEQIEELNVWREAGQFDIEECYTLTEVHEQYGISESALRELLRRNDVPRIKKGWYTYVPKTIIDKLLS